MLHMFISYLIFWTSKDMKLNQNETLQLMMNNISWGESVWATSTIPSIDEDTKDDDFC